MKKRVFIVDQNRDSALAFAAAMRAAEVSPQLFTEDGPFYAAVEEQLPDLVVLRGEMDKVSGYAICNRLRSQPRTQGLKVVIVALKDDDQAHAHEQSQLKADTYIAPPQGLKELRVHAFDLLGLEGGMAEDSAVKEFEDDSFDKLDQMLTPTDNSTETAAVQEKLPEPEKPKHDFSEEDIDGAFDSFEGKPPKAEAAVVKADEEPELIEDDSFAEVPEAPAMVSPLHDMSDEDLAFVNKSFGSTRDGGAPPLPPGITRKEDLRGPDAKIYQLREALREKEHEIYRLQQIWQQHEKQFQESAQQVLEKEVEVRHLTMEVEDLRATNKRKDDEAKQNAREYSASADRMIEEKVLLEKDLIEVVAAKEKVAYEQRRMLAARERDIEELRAQTEQKEMALVAQATQERAQYEQQLAELRASLASTVAQANADKETGAHELAQTRGQADTLLSDTRAQLQSEAANTKARLEAELAETTARLEAEVAETTARLGNELANTRDQLEGQLAETRAQLEGQLIETRSQLESQLAQTRTEGSAALEQMSAAHEAALQRMASRHEESMAAMSADSENRLAQAAAERVEERVQAESRMAILVERRDELDRQLGDKERQVQVQDTELVGLREKLTDREAMVSSKDAGLQRLVTELNEFKQRVISKESELSDIQASMRSKDERDLAQSTELARLTERLAQSESAMSEQRQTAEGGLGALQSQLDARTQAAEQAQAELGTLRERLSTLESTASERAATLMTELETSQRQQKEMASRLEQRLNQKDQIIALKDSTLEQLSKEVGTSRAEREALLQRLSERLAEREATIAKQTDDIQKLKESHVSSQGSFDARMKDVSSTLETQLRDAQQRALAAEARVGDLTTARERSDKEVAALGARLSEVQMQAGEKLDAQMLEIEQMKVFLKTANERALAAAAPAPVAALLAPSPDDAMLDDVGKKLGL